jgi:predicted esterase
MVLSIRTASALLSLLSAGCVGKRTAPSRDAERLDSSVALSPPTGEDVALPLEADALLDDEASLRPVGPFEVPFDDKRTAFVLAPRSRKTPARLIAMMHGVCVTPSYTCGSWGSAASDIGFLVCPMGNKPCDPGGAAGPTWEEPFADMDADLERSIRATEAVFPGQIDRTGAILAGFSRGAYVAVMFAVRHPGRWPFLILNEADVELTVPMMRRAGVRAVALIAGEWGAQIAGEKTTAETLGKQGYPIRLWVMPKAGHFYSTNIESIMGEAIDFVLAHEHDG